MAKKKRDSGHYCRICGELKSNESFSGKGHARHICKKCAALPLAEREEMGRMENLMRVIFKLPKSRKDWEIIERYAASNKDKASGRLAQEYLEDNSSHYRAKVAKKEQRRNTNQWYINRKAMRTIAEQIATTYTIFTKNADLQLTKSNKSAGLRARKLSLEIAALLKEFREISLANSKI